MAWQGRSMSKGWLRRPTLTAPAHDGLALLRVGMKKRDSRSNKETDQESKKESAALKPLDNEKPIQGSPPGFDIA